ncbi:MAG: PilZ domain-containing protein [Gemmatimonadota bacterium]
MRLPIQSMQAVLIKPEASDEDAWYRSVIVDFTPDKELIVVMPQRQDRLGDGDEPEVIAEAAEATPGDPPPTGTSEQPVSQAEDSSPAPADQDGEHEDDDEFVDDLSALFNSGTKIAVEISFQDGIRRFESVVRKIDLNFGGSLRIDWPTEGTRIQRRDFVRVDVGYPVVVRFEDPEEGGLRKLTGSTMDLSAGGVRLHLDEAIPDETWIQIDIDAGPLHDRTLHGRVVRSGEIRGKRGQKVIGIWVAVEFVGIDEGIRKEMTQVVFDIQRDQKKKSLS